MLTLEHGLVRTWRLPLLSVVNALERLCQDIRVHIMAVLKDGGKGTGGPSVFFYILKMSSVGRAFDDYVVFCHINVI